MASESGKSQRDTRAQEEHERASPCHCVCRRTECLIVWVFAPAEHFGAQSQVEPEELVFHDGAGFHMYPLELRGTAEQPNPAL